MNKQKTASPRTARFSRREALEELAETCGTPGDIQTMLEQLDLESGDNGVCLLCLGTERVEPDQDAGWCSQCETNSVQHGYVLAGII